MLQQRTMCFTLAALIFALAATAGARTEIDRTGTWTVTFSSAIGDHENGTRVFDNTTATKWLTAGGQTTGWVQYDFNEEEAYVIDNYTITSANDSPNRTCRDWTLQGSNDGVNWSILDTQVNQDAWSTFEERSYSFINTTAYKMYRLNVTANNGDGLMGFSEMELFEGTVDRTNRQETIAFSSELSVRESAYAAFDNSPNTKWLATQSTGWIRFGFADGAAYAINGYAITSAGDAPGRDPRDWTLEGSNNGTTWTVVDSRTDQSWGERLQRRLFEFTNTTPYAIYRLNVTANNGDTGLMGFSELELLEIVDDPAVSSMAPGNWQSISADPVVLTWDSVRVSETGTYTVHFGTDPNFTGADAVAITGLTETEYTVPAEWVTDDTVYYWQVDIVDDPYGTGTTTFAGPVVKFRVLRQVQKVLEWTMDEYGQATEYDYEIPIRNVTATASSQEQGTRSPDRTVGQWGLSVDPMILDPNGLTHSTNASQMWICNPDQEGTVWIQYAFDQVYPVGTLHVWNHNVGEPWLAELSRGMRNVIVSYSTDETNWTVLGAYEIPQGTGQPGMPPSIAIPFGGIEAQYVRITAAAAGSNWGADRNFHALSEVRFGLYNQPVVSTVMADTSGNGNDGMTYVDPQLVTEAIAGTAIDLDGNDQVYMPYDPNAPVTLPLGADEDCYESWSMNFYVMLPERSPNLAFFVGFGDFETGTGRYIAQFADGIHFWGGHNVDGITNVDFDLNRWQMITTTYEGGTLRIYKNGQEILSQATELGIAIPRAAVSGSTPWGTSAIVGLVDEFTIYRGALSEADIAALAAAMPTQYSALNPVPADAAANVGIDPILSWDAPRDALEPTYDVYLGTDENALPLVASGLTETELDILTLSAPLAYDTTYYWYVDTHNGDVSATWSFATMPATLAATPALGWDFENLTEYPQEYEQAIEDVVATASSQEATWRRAELAANGIGLFADAQIPDANGLGLGHTNRADNMWICDPDQAGDVWIQFGFDQSYPLGTMFVWNHNVGEPWTAELNRGMRWVTVSYSDIAHTDPNDWTTLGDYEIPMGTGQANLPPSIGIDFGGIEAQYVRITAADATIDPNSNWGAAGNHHALSEVRFGIYGTTATVQVVPDTSGNGNVGIPYGTTEFVDGLASGQCVKIDPQEIYGFYDHVDAQIENAAALPLGADDPWSMNFYVNLASNPSSPTLFAGFGATDIGTGRWVGRFNGVHFWGGNNIDVSSSRQYRYGQWQMVTATYSGTELALYLNGELLATGSPSGFVDAAERVSIAGWNPWGNHMNGLVDDFTLYSGVLSRGEIAALAAALPAAGDMDWNGTVEVADLPAFVLDWLVENNCTSPSDLTGDCRVDLEDFAVMAENWLSVQ